MPFTAVLDANALYPFSLRDTLLRLAELDLYTPLWSARILEEMTRNLVARRISEAQAQRIEQAMRAAFEEAEVDPGEIERLRDHDSRKPLQTRQPRSPLWRGRTVLTGFLKPTKSSADEVSLEACPA